ncbi:hypothetical protein [Streptomyces sp. NPDC007074]|uniref:hypothetical protein n=1 Tax=Streptomyces sp. NPDC007074 TaxID=3156764 RepID=UPI0033EE42B3
MTHAQKTPTSVDYRDLTPAQQAAFDQAMKQADHAGTGDTYFTAMSDASRAAGLILPNSRDIARCSCYQDAGGCGCSAIFDTAQPGVVVTATNDPNRNLSQLQCPDCGHDHPRPITD